jgi:hypothetical protein
LPSTFAFSQSSLQLYADCPRRFWLAFVERLPWPAVEASPAQEHEAQMRLGEEFHQLLRRTEGGIDPDLIASRLASLPPERSVLAQWFQDYRHHRPPGLPDPQEEAEGLEPEVILSIPFGPFRLAAKYDLIAVQEEPKRITIVDWKTSRKVTPQEFLRAKLQSIVYPYVLVEASHNLPWGPVEPEQVEMIYYFTAAPDQPVHLPYSENQHGANRNQLSDLLAAILAGTQERDFPKVPDTPRNRQGFCGYCVYRSRCNRGEAAASLDSLEDADFLTDPTSLLEFTLDSVAELAF